MDSSESWRSLFENWPNNIPRTGMLVTSYQETISFVDFVLSPGVLMVERDKPDTYGARKVMVTYDAISAVKLTSPDKLDNYLSMGFQKPV